MRQVSLEWCSDPARAPIYRRAEHQHPSVFPFAGANRSVGCSRRSGFPLRNDPIGSHRSHSGSNGEDKTKQQTAKHQQQPGVAAATLSLPATRRSSLVAVLR